MGQNFAGLAICNRIHDSDHFTISGRTEPNYFESYDRIRTTLQRFEQWTAMMCIVKLVQRTTVHNTDDIGCIHSPLYKLAFLDFSRFYRLFFEKRWARGTRAWTTHGHLVTSAAKSACQIPALCWVSANKPSAGSLVFLFFILFLFFLRYMSFVLEKNAHHS